MKRFKKVYIEITNSCNLSCNFCPKTKRKLKMMTTEEFERILNQIKPYTDYIYFHLMGEPLSHPNLKTFLQISYEKGFKVNITTNGSLLPKVKTTLLEAPALRQVNISLHSFEANNKAISLENYIEGVTGFVNAAHQESNIICSIRLWNMDSQTTKGENDLNDVILGKLQEKLLLENDLKEQLKVANGLKLKQRVYINKAEKFEWPTLNRAIISEDVFCYGLRDQIGILADGTVVPCCLDSEGNIPLGNLYSENLADILETQRAKDLYDGFSKRYAVEEMCKRCGYATRY
ncbi:MAG: radical SAM/SPASM domain-containing protein [Cellulosilyticaceae bacterium]